MSVGQVDAKPFPRWTVAFVASSINRNSGQLAAIMLEVGRSVSADDVMSSGHVAAGWVVRGGFGSG
jgi:hypothetical protein